MGLDIKIDGIEKIYSLEKKIKIDKIVIEKKKINYIIGENGSGKTTLLNIISGLDEEWEKNGSGKVENNFPKNQISLIPTKSYMLKRSVWENIIYPIKIRKRELPIKWLETLLKKLRLEKLKNEGSTKLSSGETQKVGIARGLSWEPEMVLFDEPLSNLDSEGKREFIDIVKEYKNKGKTIVIVTHEMELFEKLKGKKIELK